MMAERQGFAQRGQVDCLFASISYLHSNRNYSLISFSLKQLQKDSATFLRQTFPPEVFDDIEDQYFVFTYTGRRHVVSNVCRTPLAYESLSRLSDNYRVFPPPPFFPSLNKKLITQPQIGNLQTEAALRPVITRFPITGWVVPPASAKVYFFFFFFFP